MKRTGLVTCLIVLVSAAWGQMGFEMQSGFPVQQVQVCSDAAWVTCFLNPCMFRRCRWFPQARCEIRQTDCGCRRAWMLNGIEVNCISPATTAMPVAPQRTLVLQALARQTGPASVDQVQATPDPPTTTTATITTTRTPEATSPPWHSCPPGVRRIQCLHDPCRRATCPAAPAAVCSADYCGGCFANFFLNGMRVNCFAAPPPPIQTENLNAPASSSFSAATSSASISTAPNTSISASISAAPNTSISASISAAPNTSISASSSPMTPTAPRTFSNMRVRSRFSQANQNSGSSGSSTASTNDVRNGVVTSQVLSTSEVTATVTQRSALSSTSAATSAPQNAPSQSSAGIGQIQITSLPVRTDPVTTAASPTVSNQGGRVQVDVSGVNQQLGRFLNFGSSSFSGFQQGLPSSNTGSGVPSNAASHDNNTVA